MKTFARIMVLMAFVPVFGWAMIALATINQPTLDPVLDQVQPGPPHADLIRVGTDVDQIVFCGGGYAVGTIVNDNAFLDRFEKPNVYRGKADRHEFGIPNGPAGTRGMDLSADCTRAFIADTEADQVRVVDSSPGSKIWGADAKAAPPIQRIPGIETPLAVRVVGNPQKSSADGAVYVTAGTNDPQLIYLVRKAGDKEEYELKARLELGEKCNTPRAMVLGDYGAIYIACTYSNTVLKVGLNPPLVVAVVNTHQPEKGFEGAGPYDIAIRKAGGKIFLYTANPFSDTMSVIEDQGGALALTTAVKIPGKPVDFILCAALGIDCAVNDFPGPWSVAVSKNGQFVFVSNNIDRSVSAICAADNKVLGTWRAIPPLSIRMADIVEADTDALYVAEGGAAIHSYGLSIMTLRWGKACPAP